jgi:hypothetical protein
MRQGVAHVDGELIVYRLQRRGGPGGWRGPSHFVAFGPLRLSVTDTTG